MNMRKISRNQLEKVIQNNIFHNILENDKLIGQVLQNVKNVKNFANRKYLLSIPIKEIFN